MENEKINLLNTKSSLLEEFNLYTEDFNKKNINLEELNARVKLKEKEIEGKKDNAIDGYNLIREKKSKINGFYSFKENINKRINQVEREMDFCVKREKGQGVMGKD